MSNIIDLRKKVQPQVRIIYKTIVEKQPWYIEFAKIVAVVGIVGSIVWGITNADTLIGNKSKPFSVSGIVSSISTDVFSIDNARGGTDGSNATTYTFDSTTLQKIQINNNEVYTSIQFFDIKIGDKVVVQGTFLDNTITARRLIVSASDVPQSPAVVSATTTPEIASTTLISVESSSTPDVGTTTPEIASTTLASVESSSTPDVGTTTPADISTTTDSVATSTDTDVATTSVDDGIDQTVSTSTENGN